MNPDLKIIIRNYNKPDYPGVDELWKETGLGGSERGDNAEVIERTLKHGGKLLIMEDTENGTILGTSWITSNGRRTYIHHFGIKTEYRQKGLGYKLGVETLKYAKDLGCQIKLEVSKNNQPAIRLYRKLGFQPLGDYDIFIIRDLTGIRLK